MLLTFWSGGVNAHGVTLKLQHVLPADSALHAQFILPWTKQLEQASSGRFRFQLSPGASSDNAALLAQAKQGSVDVVCAAVTRTGRFPLFEQFAAPAAAGSAQEASRALWEYARANDIGKQEFDGVRLLAVAAATDASQSQWVLVMNAAAFKSLTDDLKQIMNANSGAEISAWLGKVFEVNAAPE